MTHWRAWVGLLGLCLSLTAMAEDAWQRVQRQGELRVGVLIDNPPFGMLDNRGDNIGFEVDLARRLAHDLGVRATLFAVTGGNRLQQLEDGKVDLLIAALGNTPVRRTQATLIEPGYYSSGVGLMSRAKSAPNAWGELRGQKICAVQGSYFNETLAQRYFLDLVIYSNAHEAMQALEDGRCAGWIYDQPAIDWLLRQPEHASFASALPPLLGVGWSMALHKTEQGGRMHLWLQDQMGALHRDGYFLTLESNWGLQPSPFLDDMHRRWSPQTSEAVPCLRDDSGTWPGHCLVGLHERDADLLQPQVLSLWWRGLWHTIALTVACVVLSWAWGLALAWVIPRQHPLVRPIWHLIVGAVRFTPPLLTMGMFSGGVSGWMQQAWSWQPSGFAVAVGCLSAYAGASVFLAIDQARAHLSVKSNGATRRSTLVLAWPAIQGVLVNVSKTTMMASALAVPELLLTSTTLMAESGQVAWIMNLMLLAFVGLGLALMELLDLIHRRIGPQS